MEQHPIPQNVTSFQFKLIGDITLKQFAYLASGVILGYLTTKFSLIPTIFRWPIGGFWALLGIGLAFVPIEERPLDRWLTSFIKSIYSPTQYVWKKQNPPPEILLSQTGTTIPIPTQPTTIPSILKTQPNVSPLFKTKPVTGFKPIPPVNVTPTPIQPKTVTPQPPPKNTEPPEVNKWTIGAPPTHKITAPIPSTAATSVTGKRVMFTTEVITPPSTTMVNTKQVEKIKSNYEQTTQRLKDQIDTLQNEVSSGNVTKEKFLELQQSVAELLGEKDRLEKELVELKQQVSKKLASGIPTEKPTTYTTPYQDTRTTVKIVPAPLAQQAGIPKLTNQPNVVTGIIKDSRGVLLPNLIVTVKDHEGVPVRALKTNRLGQFAASTPLTSNVYFIEVEDPKKTYKFNRIEVTLTDRVLPPLEISAISEKDVMRQKLTKEIFGKNTL